MFLSYAGFWLSCFPVASMTSSVSGTIQSSSSSSSYSDHSLSSLFNFDEMIALPHPLSISLSKTSCFLSSVGECSSATVRGQGDCQGTTFPFTFRIHWVISFPSPFEGPSTLSRICKERLLLVHCNSTSCRIQIDTDSKCRLPHLSMKCEGLIHAT